MTKGRNQPLRCVALRCVALRCVALRCEHITNEHLCQAPSVIFHTIFIYIVLHFPYYSIFWRVCKVFCKKNRRCQTNRFAGSKKAFSKTAHDAPIKRKSHLTNGGKLWYNACIHFLSLFEQEERSPFTKVRRSFLFTKITAAVLDNGGKLWYNTYSNRARCVCSRSRLMDKK